MKKLMLVGLGDDQVKDSLHVWFGYKINPCLLVTGLDHDPIRVGNKLR